MTLLAFIHKDLNYKSFKDDGIMIYKKKENAFSLQVRLMGNNVNGVLQWNRVMELHKKDIKGAFIFHDKFTQGADEKLLKIKEVIRQLKKTSNTKNRKKKFRKQKKSLIFPDLIFVGMHIR